MIKLIPLTELGISFTLLEKKNVESSVVASIMASYDYVYDPEHKKNPGSGFTKTEKGWSKADQKPRSEITLSPEVNVPVKNEKRTKHNETNLEGIVSKVIERSGVKGVTFGISKRKAGRYLENDKLCEESSYSLNNAQLCV